MSEFKIEYDPDYGNRYHIYRKEFKFFGFAHCWKKLCFCDTLEKAEAEIQELKKFPKYYEIQRNKK